MSHLPPPSRSSRFSPRATCAALGLRLQGLHLCGPGRDHVHMGHKPSTSTPVQPWSEACIAILAGAQGVVEINPRLRSAPGLQAALGRPAGAEPSVVQDPLEAGTEAHVEPLHRAMEAISRRHRRGDRPDDAQRLQVLEADRSGLPCGKKAAFATTGDLAHPRHHRGRQLGRVGATRYDEIVVDRLFGGTMPLPSALQPWVQATEQTLALEAGTRRRTVWRIEAGGGRGAEVNWRLAHHDHVHGQDSSGTRAQRLAERVTEGVEAPRIAARPGGGVTLAPTVYSRPGRRVAVRCRQHNGQGGRGVLISTLAPPEVIELSRHPVDRLNAPVAGWLASVSCDAQRGGGVETSLKGDKQGGVTKRHKKRFEAQPMVTPLHT